MTIEEQLKAILGKYPLLYPFNLTESTEKLIAELAALVEHERKAAFNLGVDIFHGERRMDNLPELVQRIREVNITEHKAVLLIEELIHRECKAKVEKFKASVAGGKEFLRVIEEQPK